MQQRATIRKAGAHHGKNFPNRLGQGAICEGREEIVAGLGHNVNDIREVLKEIVDLAVAVFCRGVLRSVDECTWLFYHFQRAREGRCAAPDNILSGLVCRKECGRACRKMGGGRAGGQEITLLMT